MAKFRKYTNIIFATLLISAAAVAQDNMGATNSSANSPNDYENNLPNDGKIPTKDELEKELEAQMKKMDSNSNLNNEAPAPDVIGPDSYNNYDEPRYKVAPKKKQVLKDAGNPYDDDAPLWTMDEQNDQYVIESTPHRRREIDPKKRQILTDLSRILGSLHAIRISCQGQGDQTYRSKMATMLDMEAPSAEYVRDPLIIAFNSGFEAHGQGQSSCPSDSKTEEANLAKQGRILALQMENFYKAKQGNTP